MTLHNPDDNDHNRRNPDADSNDDNAPTNSGGLAAIEYEHRRDAVDGVTIYNPKAVGKDGGEWITARSGFAHDRDQII